MTQVPVLFQSKKKQKKQVTYDLTQSDLQFLVDYNKFVLCHVQQTLEDLSARIETVWEFCNPNDPETQIHFELLNKLKDAKSFLLEQFKKLATIQTKLKSMR